MKRQNFKILMGIVILFPFLMQGQFYIINEKLAQQKLDNLQEKGKSNFREIKEYEQKLENGDLITSAVCFCDSLPGGSSYGRETSFERRYGLITKEGKVLKPLLEMILPWENNGYLIKYTESLPDYKSHNWLAFVGRDLQVKSVYPSEIGQKDVYRVKKAGKYGVISSSGYESIPFSYDSLSEMSYSEEVLVMVKESSYRTLVAKSNGKYGFILSSGDSLIQFKYSNAQNFLGKKALVEKKNKWGVIDTRDTILVPLVYDSIVRWGDDFFLMKNKKWGCMDYEMNYKNVSFIYDDFRVGNSAYIKFMKKQNKWFSMKNDKIEANDPGFDEVLLFEDAGPYTAVRRGDKWAFYLASRRKIVTPFEYTKILNVVYGRASDEGVNYPIWTFKTMKDGREEEIILRD